MRHKKTPGERSTFKSRTDDYMQARDQILDCLEDSGARKFMWLEVSEGLRADALNYSIHASEHASSVPAFAIEVYNAGRLETFEISQEVIRSNALIPEELRCRMIRAQEASGLLERMTCNTGAAMAMAMG